MSLEVRFKVENLGISVRNAGYLVMDSVRKIVQEGFTNIAEDGSVLIPITSKWVGENEKLRVTVDDYDGLNFIDSGSATDVIRATLAYVEYSVIQDGIYVTCVTKTGEDIDWDMGDGNFVEDDSFTYFYKENGTFTITSGSFSHTVTISDVTPFSVVRNENFITCTPQSGIDSYWDFGDGSDKYIALELGEIVTHAYSKNGVYTVSYGDYTQEILIDDFTDGLIQSVSFNTVHFNSTLVSGDINYGDGTSGSELSHTYPTHGTFLISTGGLKAYVTVEEYGIPVSSFTDSLDLNSSNIVTFTGQGGDTYQSMINGEYFEGLNVTYEFPASGYYPYVLNATFVNGNSNQLAVTYRSLVNNTVPVISFEAEAVELAVQFTSNVIDNDFEASHTYLWTFNKGDLYELTSTESNPLKIYQNPETPNDPVGQTFTVELQVTDNVGVTVITTKEITVYDF